MSFYYILKPTRYSQKTQSTGTALTMGAIEKILLLDNNNEKKKTEKSVAFLDWQPNNYY